MLKDLIKKNRSYRNYDRSVPVTREMLLEMVDCARQTPASMSIQPLKYYLITDEDECKTVLTNIKYAASLPDYSFPYDGKEAPAYILICQDTDVNSNPERFLKDVGIVAQTVTLAATEMGLGCCMIGNYSNDKLKEKLGLDDKFIIQLVISLGGRGEDIRLIDAKEGDSVMYYRSEDDVHYAPKRMLTDVIIK